MFRLLRQLVSKILVFQELYQGEKALSTIPRRKETSFDHLFSLYLKLLRIIYVAYEISYGVRFFLQKNMTRREELYFIMTYMSLAHI